MELIRSQKGFSLTEVMIAGALLAGIGVAIMKMMNNQTKTLKSVEASAEVDNVVMNIQKILNSSNGCNATLAARMLKVFPKNYSDPTISREGTLINSIKIKESGDYLVVGQKISNDVDLTRLEVKLDVNNFDPDSGYGTGTVALAFGKKDALYGGKDIVKEVNFYAKFTALRYYTFMSANETLAKQAIETQCKSEAGLTDVRVKILKKEASYSVGECLPVNPTELYVQDCD